MQKRSRGFLVFLVLVLSPGALASSESAFTCLSIDAATDQIDLAIQNNAIVADVVSKQRRALGPTNFLETGSFMEERKREASDIESYNATVGVSLQFAKKRLAAASLSCRHSE